MKKQMNALTGAGFTREEADELYQGRERLQTTAEQRRKHLAMLKRASRRRKAEATPGMDERNTSQAAG